MKNRKNRTEFSDLIGYFPSVAGKLYVSRTTAAKLLDIHHTSYVNELIKDGRLRVTEVPGKGKSPNIKVHIGDVYDLWKANRKAQKNLILSRTVKKVRPAS